MIIVDSSVWIDFFNGTDTPETSSLDQLLGRTPLGLGDLILTEVLQGFREDRDFRAARSLFESFTVYEMLGVRRAIVAAENFRALRRHGVTVRKTNDVIIGSFCITENMPLLFSDRDFQPMVQRLGLMSAQS